MYNVHGCISFDSYIKPQLQHRVRDGFVVVYLLIPTSNHNFPAENALNVVLYIFWFLHQTTTSTPSAWWICCCISFDSYIKPQLPIQRKPLAHSCISFDSYIKPQLRTPQCTMSMVVYLLIPTSNHNWWVPFVTCLSLYIFWFLHQTTTWQDSHIVFQ